MATLALSNAELYAELGRMLGISRTSTDWDAVTLADVNRMIRSGRRRFLSAHNWKFLVNDWTGPIAAPINTGTVTIVDGVVTFAGAAVLPSNVVTNYMFAPQGGGLYSVAARGGDAELTLNDTSVDADALSTFVLYQHMYDLPATFGGWQGPIALENYDGYTLNESRNFPEFVLRAFRGRQTVRTGRPELFSVVSTTDAETGIAVFDLAIYPLPDKAYTLSSRVKVNIGDTLGGGLGDISADPVFTECYKESVLAAAETIGFGQPGAHAAAFPGLLMEAIRQDNMIRGTRHGRPRTHGRRQNRYYDLIVGTVDMSGQEP